MDYVDSANKIIKKHFKQITSATDEARVADIFEHETEIVDKVLKAGYMVYRVKNTNPNKVKDYLRRSRKVGYISYDKCNKVFYWKSDYDVYMGYNETKKQRLIDYGFKWASSTEDLIPLAQKVY